MLDSAFHGNPNLADDQLAAFEDGRNLAYLTVSVHAVALLKEQGMDDLAAEILDIEHHPFESVFRNAKGSDAISLESSDLYNRFTRDWYTRAMNIFKIVLTAGQQPESD